MGTVAPRRWPVGQHESVPHGRSFVHVPAWSLITSGDSSDCERGLSLPTIPKEASTDFNQIPHILDGKLRMNAKTGRYWLLRLSTAAMLMAAASTVDAQEDVQASEEDRVAEDSADQPAVDDFLPLRLSDSPDLMRKPPAATDEDLEADTMLEFPTMDADADEDLPPWLRSAREAVRNTDASQNDLGEAERLTIPKAIVLDESKGQQRTEELEGLLEIVVTAARHEQHVEEAPSITSVTTTRSPDLSGKEVQRLSRETRLGVLIGRQWGLALALYISRSRRGQILTALDRSPSTT